MKKILAFVLAVMLLASLCVLGGCSDNSEKSGTADEISLLDNSELAGEWKVVSTDDEIMWSMNSQETLHITETKDGQKYTTVCRYSYDKDTGAFEYTCLSAEGSFQGSINPEDNRLIVQSNDGSTSVILRRIILENQ